MLKNVTPERRDAKEKERDIYVKPHIFTYNRIEIRGIQLFSDADSLHFVSGPLK